MKARDAYFDNLKFILILLVVVGHLIEPFNGEAAMGAIYQFIYSFHMPLFIFAAGYFAKCIQSPKQYVGLLSGLVVPYFIFETLYTLFDYYMQGLDRLDFTYFYPNWILWFLFSMMLLILLGAVITWLLSSSWIKRGFSWIVEPNVGFLFHYRSKHRHERAETKRADAKRSDA